MDAQRHGSPLILASASPRRKALFQQIGLPFDVVPSRIDESRISSDDAKVHVVQLAEAKGKAVSVRYPQSWVVAADTVVNVDNTLLGKPADRAAARDMLKALSGRTHDVLTGFAVQCRRQQRFLSDVAITRVVFKSLSTAELDWYVDTAEPYDKAGAYAIQGRGAFLVKRLTGSYTNVVGLPLCEIMSILIKEGIVVPINGGRWQIK